MQLLRSVAIGVLLGAFAFNAAGAGCNPQSDFLCATSEDCIAQGAGGVCELNMFCTFPAADCPSGKRWHDRAAASLAGDCYEDAGDTDTDPTTDPGSSSDSTTLEPEEMTSSSSGSVEPGSSSGEAMTTDPSAGSSSSGDATSTGMAGACDMMYGGATDYELCTEEVDSCSFSTSLGMVMSCTDVCTTFGGTCLSAQDNGATPCELGAVATCEQADLNNIICTCSL